MPADREPDVVRIGTLPPGGAPDEEVAGIMHELDRLQGWMSLMMCQTRGDPVPRAAYDLLQRTRALIVERLYPKRVGGTYE